MISTYQTSEFEKLQQYISQELNAKQKASRHVCIPLPHARGYFLAFHWCDVKNPRKKDLRISIYCDTKDLILVGDSVHCRRLMQGLQLEEADPFHYLAEFFFALTSEDIDTLEHMENEINKLEDNLLTSKKKKQDVLSQIVSLRHCLLKMKCYYEQLCLVMERLSENEMDILSQSIANHFAALSGRMDRLTHSVIHLYECVTQVREAYQAQIDNEQNQVMKVLTFITAVFLPLTLIVGWYGMNFQIPEFHWRFGYLYVILLSVVICIITFLVLKRKKWF